MSNQDDYLDAPMERSIANEDRFRDACERYVKEHRAELTQAFIQANERVPTWDELIEAAAEKVNDLMLRPVDED